MAYIWAMFLRPGLSDEDGNQLGIYLTRESGLYLVWLLNVILGSVTHVILHFVYAVGVVSGGRAVVHGP